MRADPSSIQEIDTYGLKSNFLTKIEQKSVKNETVALDKNCNVSEWQWQAFQYHSKIVNFRREMLTATANC